MWLSENLVFPFFSFLFFRERSRGGVLGRLVKVKVKVVRSTR